MACYRVDVQKSDDKAKKFGWVPGLSAALPFPSLDAIHAVTATPSAIFFAVTDGAEDAIYRVGARVATLEEPKKLYAKEEKLVALTMTSAGQLIVAVQTGPRVTLRFHHADSGQPLLSLPTELSTVDALVIDPNGTLYAVGTQGRTTGLFRIDAVYRRQKQATSLQLVHEKSGILQISTVQGGLLLLTDERQLFRLQFDDQ